ncbi:hypothetical protein NXY31_06100 [Bacteroides salyersiae]|nr:hypothetical protein [Bacteroides salyersiae]
MKKCRACKEGWGEVSEELFTKKSPHTPYEVGYKKAPPLQAGQQAIAQ